MNRAISRMFLVGVVLFVALVINLTWIQVFHAKALFDKPQNQRRIAEDMKIKRGRILAFDGTTLAGSVRRSGYYYRDYPSGSLAPQMVGYESVRLGLTGIEATMDDYLTGRAGGLGVQPFIDRLLGRRPTGADVKLTIVPDVQRAAQTALVGKIGAIVALDPLTGAVIASASAPTYNLGDVEGQWRRLRSDPSAPLLDRATQGLYPPGSSFKVVTAAAGLDTGKVTPTTEFDDTGTYVVYGGKVTNYHGEVFGANTFTQALTFSINTTFGKVGDLVGRGGLVGYMQHFGFWMVPPIELPAGSVLASGRYDGGTLLSPDAKMDPLAVAWAAVGQEKVLATPLQMALVAAGVADGGRVMKPYLVQQVISPSGKVVKQASPAVWQTAMSPATAATLNTMMQQVVNTPGGTGAAAALPGVTVAGKTGTAQRGLTNMAWFIAFAPADAPRVAVAVAIENTLSTGGQEAAPLAAQVLKIALAQTQLP